MFVNGRIDEFCDWYDTDGNVINASDGGMIYVEGRYYWYGMALRPIGFAAEGKGGQTTTTGVVMYSSEDLENWKYEGVVLKCSQDPDSELYGPMRFERPKIIYCENTKKFVLWCHYVRRPGDHTYAPGAAEAGVASCDRVNGEYQWHGHTRPVDEEGAVRDCTVYQDRDGSAYFIYDRDLESGRGRNRCLHAVKLSEDYLSFTQEYKRLEEAFWREAAAVVFHDGYYFMITSDLTGWDFNQAKYFRARNIMGPWEDMGDPYVEDVTKTSFHSQGTFIFRVQGKEDIYIYMAERHNTADFLHCSYIWLPVLFTEEHGLKLEYAERWSL